MATIGYILSFLVVTGVVFIFMYVVRLARNQRRAAPGSSIDRRDATTWIVTGAAIGLGSGMAAVVMFACGMLWGGPFTALGVGAVIVAASSLTVSYGSLMRNRTREPHDR